MNEKKIMLPNLDKIVRENLKDLVLRRAYLVYTGFYPELLDDFIESSGEDKETKASVLQAFQNVCSQDLLLLVDSLRRYRLYHTQTNNFVFNEHDSSLFNLFEKLNKPYPLSKEEKIRDTLIHLNKVNLDNTRRFKEPEKKIIGEYLDVLECTDSLLEKGVGKSLEWFKLMRLNREGFDPNIVKEVNYLLEYLIGLALSTIHTNKAVMAHCNKPEDNNNDPLTFVYTPFFGKIDFLPTWVDHRTIEKIELSYYINDKGKLTFTFDYVEESIFQGYAPSAYNSL